MKNTSAFNRRHAEVAQRESFHERFHRWLWRCLLGLGVAMGVAAGAVVVYYVHHFVFRSDFFKVREIRVIGATETLETEALDAIGDVVERSGENLCSLSKKRLAKTLSTLPRARSAQVRKIYPQTLIVQIEERRPLMMTNLDKIYLVDEDGVLLGAVGPGEVRRLALPILTGVSGSDYGPGDRLKHHRLDEVLEAARFIYHNDKVLQTKIVEWNLGELDQVCSILRGGTEVRFGDVPPLELLDKLSSGLMLKTELAGATYIDLRMERQLVYR